MSQYASQWRDYRRRHWAAMLGFLLMPPGLMAVSLISQKLGFSFFIPFIIIIASLLWAVIWLWLAFRITRFPCPRCGTAFNSGHACRRCGLNLYEQP